MSRTVKGCGSIRYNKDNVMKPILIFDTETTGIGEDDTVCQIAYLLVDPKTLEVVESYETLIDAKKDPHPRAFAVHGIKREDYIGKPTLEEFYEDKFKHALDKCGALSGHNLRFDLRMLKRVVQPEHQVIDTLVLARALYPTWRNHKLESVSANLKLPKFKAHDAMGDILTCLEFLKAVTVAHNIENLYDMYSFIGRSLKSVKSEANNLNLIATNLAVLKTVPKPKI